MGGGFDPVDGFVHDRRTSQMGVVRFIQVVVVIPVVCRTNADRLKIEPAQRTVAGYEAPLSPSLMTNETVFE